MSQVPLQLFPVSSTEGINLNTKNRDISYLYGLSDFWSTTFKDRDIVNTLLQATALQASDIYNRFIQLTSGICLENIQSQLNFQTTLIFLSSLDLVPGTLTTYRLPDNITYSGYIVDQPLLPRTYLEQNIDYIIDPIAKTITFSQPLSSYKFVYKTDSSTTTFALWLLDSKVENDMLYTQYATIVNISRPNFVNDTFKNFLYGLYYLYTQGPTLDIIKRGINLVLEVPISLQDETVIDIQIYDESNEYLVITDQNTYILPNGIPPLVTIGQVITQGQELGSWVDIKDYIHDGDWWLNIAIPDKIMPQAPVGQSRYATAGSYAYSLMANYLKNHTFLVNIKTTNFENIQTYTQIAEVLSTIKPKYTYPIYVWTVPLTETLTISDGDFSVAYGMSSCEKLTTGIDRFRRNSNNPLFRKCPSFTHFSGPGLLDDLLGNNPQLNGSTSSIQFEDPITGTITQTGDVTGFINQFSVMRPNDTYTENWIQLFNSRDNQYFRPPMSKAFHTADIVNAPVSTYGYDYLAALYPGKRVLRLYTTNTADVLTKFSALGITSGTISSAWFTFIAPGSSTGIGATMVTNYSTYLFPTLPLYFYEILPNDSFTSYAPLSGQILTTDFLLFVKMFEDVIGVYWVTTNQSVNPPAYVPNYETDLLTTKISGTRTRGQGIIGQTTYMTRAYPYPGNDSGHACMTEYTDLENTDVLLDRNTAGQSTLTFTRSWN